VFTKQNLAFGGFKADLDHIGGDSRLNI